MSSYRANNNHANRRANPAKLYEALQKKRASECEARQQWAGVTQYFKTWENNSNKFTTWTSPEYYKKSSELQLELQRQERRKIEQEQEEMEKWRKKIRDRQREDEEFKKEQMKKKPVSLSRPNSAGRKTPCEEMAMELRRKHDAVTDREIELRLHARSKSSDPKPKQYERRLYQRSTKSSWDDRLEKKNSAKEKQKELSEHEQRLFEERVVNDRLAEEEKHRIRKERTARLKGELVEQVAKLKARSDRCDELKGRESAYLRLQGRLEEVECGYELLEQRKTNSLSRNTRTLRQYLTMLKRKSKEMIDFSQEDRKLLDDLHAAVRGFDVDFGDRIDGLRDLFAQYEVDESQRLYLMDFMFEEEARNMWRSQEERWKNEHAVRKAGIDELFVAIKTRLIEKIDECLDEQRALIKEREELIGRVEEGNDELKRLEAECSEFYKTRPHGRITDPSDDAELKETALKITNREQKLLAEMARLDLLDSKMTDHRRKKAVW